MIRKQGHKVPPSSTAHIRDFALKLWHVFEVLGAIKDGHLDVIRAIEHCLPTAMKDFEYQIIDDLEMGDDHARTYPDKSLMQIKQSTYDGARRGIGRDRFTLAHEIGHLLMHKNCSGFARSQSHVPPKLYEDSEWQADTFAAELLMPFEQVKSATTAAEIQKQFRVSASAAQNRLAKVKNTKK